MAAPGNRKPRSIASLRQNLWEENDMVGSETKAPVGDDKSAEDAAKTATNEAERHKTGELPAKAGKVKPTA